MFHGKSTSCVCVLLNLMLLKGHTFSFETSRTSALLLRVPPMARPRPSAPLRSSQSSESDADRAQRLRQEIEKYELDKRAKEYAAAEAQAAEERAATERQERYAATVPILKSDGTVVDERVSFPPVCATSSSMYTCEAYLPLGLILGQEGAKGPIVVDEVDEHGSAHAAGVRVGDVLRAGTSCRAEMDRSAAWQLLAGGIGRPKTVRFVYSADGRPLEEVLLALGANRQDPQDRPVLMVLERPEQNSEA